ncbi:hypothetical protein MMC22_005637 [Lobaria immixta]|nr:hypothetical protein [Lobaria immixta]
MRTSCLSSLALCFAVLATATPGHVLEKRFSILSGDTVTINDVVYPPGSFVDSAGGWVEGPDNPICDMSCLNPDGTNAESCSKPGCDGGVSFLSLLLSASSATRYALRLQTTAFIQQILFSKKKLSEVGVFADQSRCRVREQRSGHRLLGKRFGDLCQGQQYPR